MLASNFFSSPREVVFLVQSGLWLWKLIPVALNMVAVSIDTLVETCSRPSRPVVSLHGGLGLELLVAASQTVFVLMYVSLSITDSLLCFHGSRASR
jgi:hypothetical protein